MIKEEIPIPCLLFCPKCNKQHIDKDEWATKLHKTHLCAHCGHKWKPLHVPSVGVTLDELHFIIMRGF